MLDRVAALLDPVRPLADVDDDEIGQALDQLWGLRSNREKSGADIAWRLPTLGLTLGDLRPHVKGKIREYLPL